MRWNRSERLTAAVRTREGEVAIVTPFFEEPSVRESLGVEAEVLTWNEDENPLAAVAAWLGKRGLARDPLVIANERVQVAVARVEDVADPQTGALAKSPDASQDVRQLRAGHDAVLHVVVGRDASHGGECGLDRAR